MEERFIEVYYSGAKVVVRCRSLEEMPEATYDCNPQLIGDIRRGILIDTEVGYIAPVLYTHDAMIDKGYKFDCHLVANESESEAHS